MDELGGKITGIIIGAILIFILQSLGIHKLLAGMLGTISGTVLENEIKDSSEKEENDFWKSIDKCGTKNCYNIYLNSYPNGAFNEIAEEHLINKIKEKNNYNSFKITTLEKKEIPFLPIEFLNKNNNHWDLSIGTLSIRKNDEKFIIRIDGKILVIDSPLSFREFTFLIKDPFSKLNCIDGFPDNGEFGGNPTLTNMNIKNWKKISFSEHLFSFFDSTPSTLGILTWISGSSGGSSQVLYLFDTKSTAHVVINYSDCSSPYWIDLNKFPPPFATVSYMHYIGGRAHSIGLGARIEKVFKFNENKNNYERSFYIETEWFKKMLSKSILSKIEHKNFESLTFDKLINNSTKKERDLAVKFMDFLYYSKKTGNDGLANFSINKLDKSLSKEFRESFSFMEQ